MSAFILDRQSKLRGVYSQAIDDLLMFCGNIFDNKSILNVGCGGEMIMDFRILQLNARKITGLDIWDINSEFIDKTAEELRGNGFDVDENYKNKLEYILYNGRNFPFYDNSFETIFSWSAFEHIEDTLQVLEEMHRVLKKGGVAFVQVHPWYHTFYGSHLTDWVSEPFFHMSRPDDWVLQRLEEHVVKHPSDRDFVMNGMFNAYKTLNKHSARSFYRDVQKAGFTVSKAKLISFEQDLSQAPPDVDFADLMIGGTMMLLSKS